MNIVTMYILEVHQMEILVPKPKMEDTLGRKRY